MVEQKSVAWLINSQTFIVDYSDFQLSKLFSVVLIYLWNSLNDVGSNFDDKMCTFCEKLHVFEN